MLTMKTSHISHVLFLVSSPYPPQFLNNQSDRSSIVKRDGQKSVAFLTEGKKQALVGAIPYCGEYPGPRFEDKFRSANQMDGISKADEIK